MGDTTELRLLLPRQVRRFPRDLAVVVGLTVAAGLAASLPGVRGSVLRVLFGLPFALFLPGYAITAALFPAAASEETGEVRVGRNLLPQPHEGVTILERAVFSVGVSITVVPLVGLALNFSPWPISFGTLLLSVGGLTVGTALYGAVRRWRLPPDERFAVPYDEWSDAARAELFESSSTLETALNAIIVLSMLVAVGSGAYATLGPSAEQTFTEFYLLGENDEGELVADGYPTTFGPSENATFVVGIGNHERETVEYSVVARLQRTTADNGTRSVVESQRLDQFRVEVPANETVQRRHTVSPRLTGERLRLQYLLYRGAPPENPTAESAYRSVHVWVNVTETA
ncbi:DUF1616 domain-containing protein [Halorussus ruber]|uniref:DUF1616 domain-containing protein n=1 Tax=Halorussus ruber TaxID=1126238 RepID=UPI001091A524|nr:DUF1616 domain-containing protein [Halorussus ruber]